MRNKKAPGSLRPGAKVCLIKLQKTYRARPLILYHFLTSLWGFFYCPNSTKRRGMVDGYKTW
jgi:hypothetical protein